MEKLKKGFYTALGTPLDKNGDLIADSLVKEINMQIDACASGLLLMGSMGIEPTIKNSAFKETVRVAAEAVAGRVPLFVGCMDNSVERVKERIDMIKDYNFDGVVLTTPFYGTAPNDQLIRFFERVADYSPKPLFLYDLAVVTKQKITYPMLEKLAKHPNIKGIKSGDIVLARQVKRNMPTKERSFAILDAAYEGGVTVLDTSDDYGKSEEVIGDYLRENPDKHFEICTKFKVTEETSKDIYASLKDFALKSCQKLAIDRIPIFMSHTEKNYIDYGDKLVDALNELKNEGIITNSAISLSNKDEFERIIDCGGFDAVQIPLNILDNKEIQCGLVKKASDAGIAVFVRSVYLQGLFFRKKEDFLVQNPNAPELKLQEMNEKVLPVIERVREFADELNVSVAQLAMSFIKDTYGVDSLVVGSETPEQVKNNLEMFNQPEISEDILAKILNEFKDIDPFVISPWMWEVRHG